MQDRSGNGAPRYAVVYTTYGWDGFIDAQYRRNAARVASGDMHVVVDESHGAVAVPTAYRKTTASEAGARALGLRIAYHRALFWHNLDYLYYIFYDRFPDYDYYVFLDYDAVINLDVDSLVMDLSRRGIDYIGDPVKGPISDWGYLEEHTPFYDHATLEARISAVTALSNRALAHLARRRQQDSVAPSRRHQTFWPFCEAFVPNELKCAGFVSADLADFGSVDRFAWWPPTLDETLVAEASENAFVHPVLDRPRFIGSMLRHSRTLDFLYPWSRLWRAVASCPDRRWLLPLLTEAGRRVRRVVLRRSNSTPVETVGMEGLNDAGTASRGPTKGYEGLRSRAASPVVTRPMAAAGRRS